MRISPCSLTLSFCTILVVLSVTLSLSRGTCRLGLSRSTSYVLFGFLLIILFFSLKFLQLVTWFFLFFFNLILFFNFTILYWFCQISKWIRHRYTCVPHPEPSSLLPPHPIPLGRPSSVLCQVLRCCLSTLGLPLFALLCDWWIFLFCWLMFSFVSKGCWMGAIGGAFSSWLSCAFSRSFSDCQYWAPPGSECLPFSMSILLHGAPPSSLSLSVVWQKASCSSGFIS